jgi:hypothetical protein
MNSSENNAGPEIPVRKLQPYKCTNADKRIRREIKVERGLACERCHATSPAEKLAVHHILETRSFPEFAREPLNMIVLCSECHSEVTEAERFGTSMICRFYSSLPAKIRERYVVFLKKRLGASSAIVEAIRSGNSDYWNDKAVRDWTR